ncbi:hypothetical protein UPYG_G00243180 [Umbra pygmaea]|uniref:Ig-like domain-containing protein n=1 Tax=Umbra pygmaea TaxID=75934 RepID=A0ABD0WL38_UMBPY
MLNFGPAAVKASLHVSPDKSQFFTDSSFSPACKSLVKPEGMVYSNTTAGVKKAVCRVSVVTCTVDKVKTSDSGVYWCESGSEVLNTVNITVHGGPVILESPALPVNEGRSVTLRCRFRENNKPKQSSLSCLTADFYRDGSLIRNESTGEMTIHAVNKSDEGLWKCRCDNHGESPESWMTVTSTPTNKMLSTPLGGSTDGSMTVTDSSQAVTASSTQHHQTYCVDIRKLV